MPFLAIRVTYAMLSVVDPESMKWNNLSGSIGIFVVMDLMMEYATMVVFIAAGLMIPRIAANKAQDTDGRLNLNSQGSPAHEPETIYQTLYRRWKERD